MAGWPQDRTETFSPEEIMIRTIIAAALISTAPVPIHADIGPQLDVIQKNWEIVAAFCYRGGMAVQQITDQGRADTPAAKPLIAKMKASCYVK